MEAEADKVAKQAAEHLKNAKKRARAYADNQEGKTPGKKLVNLTTFNCICSIVF